MLRRGATYVTSAILPIRNVDLTSLPVARIVLILKAELFLRTTTPQPAPISRPPKRLGTYTAHPAEQPLSLQDHSQPVRFRNIWVRKINPSNEQ